MKKWPSFVIGFCLCAAFFGALTWKLNTSTGTTTTEEYKQQIRNGLAEIAVPTSGNIESINSASDNLANFIYYRSGVQISQANRGLLQSAEQKAWSDSKRVDAATLTQILTDIAAERIPTLTNAEIAGITDSLRGFNAPGLPASFQGDRVNITLRARGYGRMSAESFSTELSTIRDGGAIIRPTVKSLIYTSLATEVDTLIDTLRETDPQFFGGTRSSMTPLKAFLVAYAVVADDALTHNQADLTQKMQNAHQRTMQVTGGNFPSPEGHKAYGDNGYFHNSPTSIILNDASVARLLNLIQERAN